MSPHVQSTHPSRAHAPHAAITPRRRASRARNTRTAALPLVMAASLAKSLSACPSTSMRARAAAYSGLSAAATPPATHAQTRRAGALFHLRRLGGKPRERARRSALPAVVVHHRVPKRAVQPRHDRRFVPHIAHMSQRPRERLPPARPPRPGPHRPRHAPAAHDCANNRARCPSIARARTPAAPRPPPQTRSGPSSPTHRMYLAWRDSSLARTPAVTARAFAPCQPTGCPGPSFGDWRPLGFALGMRSGERAGFVAEGVPQGKPEPLERPPSPRAHSLCECAAERAGFEPAAAF